MLKRPDWGNRLSAFATSALLLALPCAAAQADSVARTWNEQLLEAVRNDTPRPTIHARTLFHVSAAMYDTYMAFGEQPASQYLVNERIAGPLDTAARDEAISFAAFRMIQHRFSTGPGGTGPGQGLTNVALIQQMVQLGYNPSITTTVGNSPAAIGNRIAQAYIDNGYTDGANELNDYAEPTGYAPVNPPMSFDVPGTVMNDPNRWQPLKFERERFDQFGNTITEDTQEFLSPYWGDVTPFALPNKAPNAIYHDVGAPPQLNGVGDQEFRESVLEVIRYSSRLDPTKSTQIDISPATQGNRVNGTYENVGHTVNPHTGQPYQTNMVNEADYGRVMAEFWADGPTSSAPPGHWNELTNQAIDSMEALGIDKRIGGAGPVINDLEYDIKAYFTVNGALHDAAVAAWNHKGAYDYSRPVSMIRYQGQLGQSSDPLGPSYHQDGLLLEDGLVEVITAATTMPGEKHEHLAGSEGKIAIYAWQGPPEEPFDDASDIGGVDWILAEEWLPYQLDTFVTPPFAAYLSGHSTFSAAAAEALTNLTGDPFFPGGLGEYVIQAEDGLEFEYGPTDEIVLQWATYKDAADEAGVSRLWGGIHVRADDLPGRIIGEEIGEDAWLVANSYFEGAPIPEPTSALLLGVGAMLVTRRRR